MEQISLSAITVDTIKMPLYSDHAIEVSMLRLDRIHPVVSGNKWFKLQFFIHEARQTGKDHIITFGGAYSNHVVATAAACSFYGLRSTAIIRGEQIGNHTLDLARSFGMNLHFISRENYKDKQIPFGLSNRDLVIPEGGYGKTGAKGAATIFSLFNPGDFDFLLCACGTGTMSAGLANAAENRLTVEAYSVLKNENTIKDEIIELLDENISLPVIRFHHFGGYAKRDDKVIQHMNDFFAQTGIPTDFVYTGKLVAGLAQEIRNKTYPPGSRILLVHSGGLQGNESLPNGTLIF